MKKVALIGYSGHALVVAETLIQCGYYIIGYFEENQKKSNPFNIPWLGYEKDVDFSQKLSGAQVFPAIGDNTIREEIMTHSLKNKIAIATILNPSANISSFAVIGIGTIVCQGACINAYSAIERGVIINTGTIIEHECKIEDYAHIAPGAVLAGNVRIGHRTLIGANSTVKENVSIGKNVIIGAGSVVLENISDNEIWVGNPAKRIG